MTKQVLEFIQRRFSNDSNWLNGNCYYFAVILHDRFPNSTIMYDAIDGHFTVLIGETMYDWQGVVDNSGKHYYIEWDRCDEYDSGQRKRIVKDCIM